VARDQTATAARKKGKRKNAGVTANGNRQTRHDESSKEATTGMNCVWKRKGKKLELKR
jgi:hypothetical protein